MIRVSASCSPFPQISLFFFFLMIGRPPRSPLFPSTTLFRSSPAKHAANITHVGIGGAYRGKTNGGARTRAIVVKVTVAVAMVDPLSVTDDGDGTSPGAAIGLDRKSTRLNSSH